ncbi:DUF2207 domain-containing protein [Calothrix sp. PCC 7507]|uniref:DUF2207 domain-containing protein n=1 Tax=Calothrix sp. PCC 7507 TaxID=99598 RepID=UPI00029F09AD|nr:DUF2207 domain-containing protein [Calothrix sp. PCC 7507]AFY34700.1 Protein of unknown function DUF2207, membrane [Calothrix sp. PCC 7507]
MNNKLIQRLFLFGIILCLGITFFLNQFKSQSVPFYWEFIDADIAVQNNGDMLINETQKYTFTRDYNNQRYRYISLNKIDKITDVSVSENGQTLASETGTKNKQFWIRWSHQLRSPESHTFVLKYRVVGGLHVDSNTNDAQVYWNAIFTDRKAAIKQAKVRVTLPEKVTGEINNFRSFGVTANATKIDAKTVEFVTQASIEPQQKLEVQVTFNRTGSDIKMPQWQSFKSPEYSPDWFALIFCVIFFVVIASLYFSRRSSGSVHRNRSSSRYKGGGSVHRNYSSSRYKAGGCYDGSSGGDYSSGYDGGGSCGDGGGGGGGGDGGGGGGDGGGG